MRFPSGIARLVGVSAAFAVLGLSAMLTVPGSANALTNGIDVVEGQYRFSTKLTMTAIPRADGTS